LAAAGLEAQKSHVTNVVLVHGAWVDGSDWKPLYDILIKDGYTVTLVQEPLTSFAEDVAATRRVPTAQNGVTFAYFSEVSRNRRRTMEKSDLPWKYLETLQRCG
jgi:hypothetical protein